MTTILEKPRSSIQLVQRAMKDANDELGAAHEAVIREQARIAVLTAALAEYESDLSILEGRK